MLHSLRIRLTLSHILPVLVLMPLFSLALLYLLETRYVLGNLAVGLATQGELVAEIIQYDQRAWSDPGTATEVLRRIQLRIPARIMILDREGRLLSSNWQVGTDQNGQAVAAPVVKNAIQQQNVAWRVEPSLDLQAQVVDVAVPVFDGQGRLVGSVRLSHTLAEIYGQLSSLRWFVVGVALAGTVFAVVLGLLLARSLALPLTRLTEATRTFRVDAPPQPLPATGPSELKALAATFNEMAERLYDLELGRRRLLTSVVHELGRPLGAMKAAAQVLEGANQEPEVVGELAAGIDEQVDHLKLLVDDLALLAKSETQELKLELQPTRLDDLVEAECQNIAHRLHEKNIVLTQEIPAGLPVVQVDPVRIAQVVGNLLDNAYKYTPEGGRVAVGVRSCMANGHPRRVEVRVSDTGPGIDPSEQEKVFQFFYRSPGQRHLHQGMGIGLALGRRLAEAHGGSLRLESQPGRGATFVLALPLTPTPGND